jgi:hypothetical protein
VRQRVFVLCLAMVAFLFRARVEATTDSDSMNDRPQVNPSGYGQVLVSSHSLLTVPYNYDVVHDSDRSSHVSGRSVSAPGVQVVGAPATIATRHGYDVLHLLRFSRTSIATKPGTGISRACRTGNSLASDTEVAIADGSRKAISELKVGDRVLATDPETGVTAAREVTAVHLNLDTALADVIGGDGDMSMINTTQHHPFWNVGDSEWTDVIDLDKGDRLRSVDGSLLTVVSVRSFMGQEWMWDLTVDEIHSFYVANGGHTVLVHNCNPVGTRRSSFLEPGAAVKNFVGPPNAVVKGASPGRVFVTDGEGRVIFDITKDRVKPVVPGQGFVAGDGRKLVPIQEQEAWITQLWG